MRSRPVAVAHIRSHNSPQMRFPEHHDMIEALPAQVSDYPLHVRTLPGTVRRNDHLLNAESLHSFSDVKRFNADGILANDNQFSCRVYLRGSVSARSKLT